jgi:hypothetical protein
MKRQWPQNHDANYANMRAAGRLAREQGKPLRACPSLLRYFGEQRAIVLMDAWMSGWYDADSELRSPRAAMKGAD